MKCTPLNMIHDMRAARGVWELRRMRSALMMQLKICVHDVIVIIIESTKNKYLQDLINTIQVAGVTMDC